MTARAGALCCEAKAEAKTKTEAKPVATYRFTEALKHFMELPIEEEGEDAKRTVLFQTRKMETMATLYENNKEELVQAKEGDVVAMYKWDRTRFAKAKIDMVGSAVFEKREQYELRNENGVFNLALNDKDLVVVIIKQDTEREGYEFYEFEFTGKMCSCEITPDIVVSKSEENIAPVSKEGLLEFLKIFFWSFSNIQVKGYRCAHPKTES